MANHDGQYGIFNHKRKKTDWGPYSDPNAHIRLPSNSSSLQAHLGGNSKLDNKIKGNEEGATIPISGGFGGVQKIVSTGFSDSNELWTTNFLNGVIGFVVAGIVQNPFGGTYGFQYMVHYIDLPAMMVGENANENVPLAQIAKKIQDELAYSISIQFNKTYPRYQFNTFDNPAAQSPSYHYDPDNVIYDTYPSPLVRDTDPPIRVSVVGAGQLCFRSNYEAGYTNAPEGPLYFFNIFTPYGNLTRAAGKSNIINSSTDVGWIERGAHLFGFGKHSQINDSYEDDFDYALNDPKTTFKVQFLEQFLQAPFVSLGPRGPYFDAIFCRLKQFVCAYMPCNLSPSRYIFQISEELTSKQQRSSITNGDSGATQIVGIEISSIFNGNRIKGRDEIMKNRFIPTTIEFNPMYNLSQMSFDFVDEWGDNVTAATVDGYSGYIENSYQWMYEYGRVKIPYLLSPNPLIATPLLPTGKTDIEPLWNYKLMSNSFLLMSGDIIPPPGAPPLTPALTILPYDQWIPGIPANKIPLWNAKPAATKILFSKVIGF